MSTNTLPQTKLQVTGARMLILREEAAEKIGSIILPAQSQERPRIGHVVKVGPGARNNAGQPIPMDVKVGDKILYKDFAGAEVKDEENNITLTILNEADVLAIIGE